MPTYSTTAAGQVAGELREARKARGLTQAQLAALAGCSLSIIGAIEGGAVPKQSAVVERVRDVLASMEDEHPAAEPGAVRTSRGGDARHDPV